MALAQPTGPKERQRERPGDLLEAPKHHLLGECIRARKERMTSKPDTSRSSARQRVTISRSGGLPS
jgi:hypothetical protein